jgi:hypothetical protein
VVLAVLVPFPFTRRKWALPLLAPNGFSC